jgi:1,4-alpha-glucan branching enzyme
VEDLNMVETGRKKGSTRFVIRPVNGTKRAFLAGSFTDWQPTRMRRQKDGSFVSVQTIPPGAYEYKFILDDEWIVDPDNSAWTPNSFGSVNSVVNVA